MINPTTSDLIISKLNEQLASIPAGKIDLRDDRTKQQWSVEIEPFFLAKFPVTQDVYFDVLKESPSTFKGDKLP
ncbi:MAG: hypothetical protein B0A82_05135, partial [Alkalinema sp. CACIAM 70d]